jgi:hypothetical protein
MQRVGAVLWPTLQCFQIYGANTGVGKTIVSTLLCKTLSRKRDARVHYVKPVSTGPRNEEDVAYVTSCEKKKRRRRVGIVRLLCAVQRDLGHKIRAFSNALIKSQSEYETLQIQDYYYISEASVILDVMSRRLDRKDVYTRAQSLRRVPSWPITCMINIYIL